MTGTARERSPSDGRRSRDERTHCGRCVQLHSRDAVAYCPRDSTVHPTALNGSGVSCKHGSWWWDEKDAHLWKLCRYGVFNSVRFRMVIEPRRRYLTRPNDFPSIEYSHIVGFDRAKLRVTTTKTCNRPRGAAPVDTDPGHPSSLREERGNLCRLTAIRIIECWRSSFDHRGIRSMTSSSSVRISHGIRSSARSIGSVERGRSR